MPQDQLGNRRPFSWFVHRALVALPYLAGIYLIDAVFVLVYYYMNDPDLFEPAVIRYGIGLLITSLLAVVVIAMSRNRDLPVTFAAQVTANLFLVYILGTVVARSFYSTALTILAFAATLLGCAMLAIHLAKFLADRVGWIGGVQDADRRQALGPRIIDASGQAPDSIDTDILVVGRALDSHDTDLIARSYARGLEVIPFPKFFEYRYARVYLPDFNVQDFTYTVNQRLYIRLKRLSDIIACVGLAPVVLPVAGLTALFILMTNGRPVLFRQERIGLNDEPFSILKFRTMSEARPDLATTTTQIGDARIIRGGRIIRRFRIDELPQLLHVLSGRMSLIGPRPEWSVLVDRYAPDIPEYNYRHLVRPGLSGWAQVKMGYAADIPETKRKVSYDLYYVKNISLELDLRILIKTLRILFGGSGAR